MNRFLVLTATFLACTMAFATSVAAQPASATLDAPVTAPPDSFFDLVRERDRDAARKFYRKYLAAQGMPIVAAETVDDRALRRTREIVTRMLAGRPDVVRAMAEGGMYQVYTDMPEYRNHSNPAYQNERVRGTGLPPVPRTRSF